MWLYRRTSSRPKTWSACVCVKRIASTRLTSLASACSRRSVDVSTRITGPFSASSTIDGRRRRSCGSVERQTAQSQPIAGTPVDVPLPSTVTLRFNNPLPLARRLDEPQAQLVKDLFEHLALFCREIAARFLFQERQNLDHLRGAVEIQRRRLARDRVGQISEMNGRCTREGENEGAEGQVGHW